MACAFLISKFKEYEDSRAWREVFHNLLEEDRKQQDELQLKSTVGVKILNLGKDRYRDISPWDSNRVLLRDLQEDQTDYINASPLDVAGAERRYILTQGPLDSTCNDFWQMCWESGTKGIIMLNRIVEMRDGRPMEKAARYFPTSAQKVLDFHSFEVNLLEEKQMDNYLVRRIKLKKSDSGEAREIEHLQYTEWPDYGVPQCTQHFLDFLDDCRVRGLLTVSPHDPPPIVHCSAGVGRTGTFVVCDSVLHMVESKNASTVDPEALILELRKSRMGLIQTPEQLRFCWMAIVDRLKDIGDSANCEKQRGEGEQAALKKESNVDGEEKKEKPASPQKRSSDEEAEAALAKRREKIGRMVARSRAAEARRGDWWTRPSSRWAVAGIVAASAVIYYLAKTQR